MPQRIGIFGGSFNPVHNAHLAVAQAARRELKLDRVLLIPAAIPPHKQNERLASDKHRLEMLRLAVSGRRGIEVDDREIRKGGVSYTVETIEELVREFPPGTRFVLILGSDSLVLFPKWKSVNRIFDLVEIAVYPRRGFAIEDLGALTGKFAPEQIERLRHGFLSLPPVDLSATEIRERWQRGEPVKGLLPESVEEYLRRHALWK